MATLHDLAALGQDIWIDDLSRTLVRDGELEELKESGVTGLTSNPSIFQKAIGAGEAYDEQLRTLRDLRTEDAFWTLAVQDVQEAADILAPGWVSLEVGPTHAYDTTATISEAQRLHRAVDRPNVFIKIPATEPGLNAIEESIAAGIPINVTLIFSLERHRAVADAYVRGVRRLVESGGDASSVASVASFFISRVDTEADKRLDEIGGHGHLRGTLAIANAKLAYAQYLEVFSGPEWESLEAAGATKQRCLWASTSTKDKAYRDTLYVEELAGPDTVNTLPRETIDAFIDHGEISGPRLLDDLEDAQKTLDAWAKAGVDYDDVVDALEREGVEKFSDAFTAMIEDVESKREELAGAAS